MSAGNEGRVVAEIEWGKKVGASNAEEGDINKGIALKDLDLIVVVAVQDQDPLNHPQDQVEAEERSIERATEEEVQVDQVDQVVLLREDIAEVRVIVEVEVKALGDQIGLLNRDLLQNLIQENQKVHAEEV